MQFSFEISAKTNDGLSIPLDHFGAEVEGTIDVDPIDALRFGKQWRHVLEGSFNLKETRILIKITDFQSGKIFYYHNPRPPLD